MFARLFAMVKSARGAVSFPNLAHKLESHSTFANLGLVLALHVVLIWLLASQLAQPMGLPGTKPYTQVALIASVLPSQPKPYPVPEPQFATAITSEVTPPNIEIQETAPATGSIGTTPAATILPPRPDPAIRNVNPALPTAFAKTANRAEVLLTILVNADGSIGEARVVKSCGVALLDQLAQTFAKANWRFRPATANGEAVSDWTTVMVKFAPTS
jgi:periplasmic protein TonB